MRRRRKRNKNAAELLQASLLPFCRILIKHDIGIGALIDAAKISYVQAAIRETILPGSRINISRLAVVTGLTRKEIAMLLNREASRDADSSMKKALQHRALRVLQGWSVDPVFHGSKGRPADLPLQGDQRSFSLLVKRHGGDVTPISVLRELERMKAISLAPSGKIRLRRRGSDSGINAAQQLAEFIRLFKDFSNTIRQTYDPKEPPIFFGFKDSKVASSHQVALFHRTFAKRAGVLLEGMDQWIRRQMKEKKSIRVVSKSKTRIGLGVYLVQDRD